MAKTDLQAPPVREDGLQLEERRAFQEGYWKVQRIAWIFFALLLVVALLGFTGSGGPFAHASTNLSGGSIEYPRIARWEAADEIVVRFGPGGSERRLRLSAAFSEWFQIEGVQPDPVRTIAGPQGAVLIFDAEPGEAATVMLHVTPLSPGFPSFEAGLDNGAPVTMTTLVLP